ncbi:MAG TPA: glycosyltransferase [Anaeromyxobacteraceae bacterium]
MAPPAPEIFLRPAGAPPAGARFTVVIPTWNNLPFARLCVESIRRNSAFPHQVVLHVNDGSDGTLEWVRAQGLDHTWSRQNAGICLPVNAAASLARTDFVVYMNDDMYVGPGWDAALWRALMEVGHRRCFLSATVLEPEGDNACAFPSVDFGDHPDRFREADLLAALPSFQRRDWSGASWPPNLVHRELWQMVGGYSVEFSPGFYSDPDFSMKLWRAGVRIFRGVAASKVYHFRKKSTGRVRPNDGRRQFALKWGVPSSFFYRRVLRMGQPFAGPLPEMEDVPGYGLARLRAWRHRLGMP